MPHGAAPFLVPKLSEIQSRIRGAERVPRLDPGWIPYNRCAPPPPALRVHRSAVVPAAAAGGRPNTAPAGLWLSPALHH